MEPSPAVVAVVSAACSGVALAMAALAPELALPAPLSPSRACCWPPAFPKEDRPKVLAVIVALIVLCAFLWFWR